jgi:hypothetical protein
MREQRESNERERRQLGAGLAAEREALLAVVSDVDEQALARPTRNPEWTVRDVLAHVLASDADLISLVEAAGRPDTRTFRHPSLEGHQQEMARWAEATPQAFARELQQRGNRWRDLVVALPDSALGIPVSGSWWPPATLSGSAAAIPVGTSGGVRALGEVVGDWRGHDSQHGEDVRLALAQGGGAPEPPRRDS